MDRLNDICAKYRHSGSWEGVGPASLVTLLLRSDVHCFLLLLKHAQRNVFSRQLLGENLNKNLYIFVNICLHNVVITLFEKRLFGS